MQFMRSATLCGLLVCVAATAQVPCFESNLGTNLQLANDTVSPNLPLGFVFPGPGGVPVSSIGVSDNGFIWLGGNNTNSRSGFAVESAFLQGGPSIAALWEDLNPSRAGAGVFFNTFPHSTTPARAVITWSQVPEFGSVGLRITTQIQLLDTGGFIISQGASNGLNIYNALIGVTQGNGAMPDPIVFSSLSGVPHDTGANPTVYQLFNVQTSSPSVYDTSGRTYEFVLNGRGGYLVLDRSDCRQAGFHTFGTGCPGQLPQSFYEEFPQATVDLSGLTILAQPNGNGGWSVVPGSNSFFNGFTNNLGLGVGTVAGPVDLPFTWVHPGGATSSIYVSSDGLIWFRQNWYPGGNPDHLVFLFGDPSLALLWGSYDPRQAVAGGVFADADPNGQAFYVTFANVPEFLTFGPSITCQLALFANGSFELRYITAANVSGPTLVGYSTGNYQPPLPPGRDLSASLPFDTGPGRTPLALSAFGSSVPRIGTTFTMSAAPIPAGSSIGFLLLGLQRANRNLANVGMPGCTAWVDSVTPGASVTLAFITNGTSAPINLPIPNNASFVAMSVFAQVATASAGFTPLGVITSNGTQIDLGL
jgi:hypothetical protein